MIITFLGADHEVTGSCHYLQVGDKKAIVVVVWNGKGYLCKSGVAGGSRRYRLHIFNSCPH